MSLNSKNGDRVVVVTGATGGLGSALCSGFASSGYRVFATDRNQERLNTLTHAIQQEGGRICAHVADISDNSQACNLVDRAAKTYGQIDVLINNAAVATAKPMLELTEADWDETLNVNVKGLFFTLQTAAKYMIGSGGSIINIASVAGRVGRPALLHYAASKAAVISITRSAATGLAAHQIRVNAIAPGMMETSMLHDLQSSLGQNSGPGNPPSQSIPLGRIARPEEIVATALFLASDKSAYVTGQTWNVDGGIVMS